MSEAPIASWRAFSCFIWSGL